MKKLIVAAALVLSMGFAFAMDNVIASGSLIGGLVPDQGTVPVPIIGPVAGLVDDITDDLWDFLCDFLGLCL
ncbi:MAG: hypothetical protein ACRESZ_17545 [Methylococcales bacterium]